MLIHITASFPPRFGVDPTAAGHYAWDEKTGTWEDVHVATKGMRFKDNKFFSKAPTARPTKLPTMFPTDIVVVNSVEHKGDSDIGGMLRKLLGSLLVLAIIVFVFMRCCQTGRQRQTPQPKAQQPEPLEGMSLRPAVGNGQPKATKSPRTKGKRVSTTPPAPAAVKLTSVSVVDIDLGHGDGGAATQEQSKWAVGSLAGKGDGAHKLPPDTWL